jgi:two-component system, NtrC family, response regulator HydG
LLCDYRLPDSDGYEILHLMKLKKPGVPVIIMTAYADIKMAVNMIKSGAFDYVTKPIHPDEILQLINRALETKAKNETQSSFGKDFVVGKSKKMQDVMRLIQVVSPTDLTVLIEGETGSGKEYVARAIHYASPRSKKPFIPVDCGSIPKELANSELFGHIKGAFTGAINDKIGYFEHANGGTVFLDEVGNLPYENQAKLLRALQERIINKVGDNKSIKVDVRLIAATNDDLVKQIEAFEFREDLYHRINGFKIQVPSLRHRKEDIMEFTNFFIKKANKAFNKNITGVDERVKELFQNYQWHGNIRELQNVINRAVLLSQTEIVKPEVLPDEIKFSNLHTNHKRDVSDIHNNDIIPELKEATEVTEKEVILNALIKTSYNKSKAAKMLKIDRKTLYNKIKLYEIEVLN